MTMKGRLVFGLATLGLIATAPAIGQETFVGIGGGATLSEFAGGAIVSPESQWGATAGLTFGVRKWDYALSMVEVNWIQRGGKIAGEETRVDYLEIPFLIGGSTPADYGFSGRVFTGLTIAFPVSCSAPVESTCDGKRSPTVSWPLGGQIGRSAGPGRFIGVEARYFVGLSDTFQGSFFHDRGWQFRGIVTFPVGGSR
jgi:hypothetical protein